MAAHAAAAVVGMRRARESRESGRAHYTTDYGISCPACIATVFSISMVATGITFLVRSATNQRGQMLQNFHDSVVTWTNSERQLLEATDFKISADWASKGSDSSILVASRSKGFTLHDTENGKGVDDYKPLAHVTTVDFPAAFENVSGDALASAHTAPSVHLVLKSGVNGSWADVGSDNFPIVFKDLNPSLTTHDKNHCMYREHGVKRGHNCVIGKRLHHICLQVERDASGSWHFKRHAQGGHVYGCGPSDHWSPVEYETDICLADPMRRTCTATDTKRHHVYVEVRSSADPLLSIETLTHDTFDFGMSPVTQQVYGSTMLALGLIFGLLPCCNAMRACCCPDGSQRRTPVLKVGP